MNKESETEKNLERSLPIKDGLIVCRICKKKSATIFIDRNENRRQGYCCNDCEERLNKILPKEEGELVKLAKELQRKKTEEKV